MIGGTYVPVTIYTVYCFDVISWFKNLAINRVEVGGEAGGRNEVDCSGLKWPLGRKMLAPQRSAAAAAVCEFFRFNIFHVLH